MSTVLDMLTGALELGAVIDPGETLSAAEAQSALNALNTMLESQVWQGLGVVAVVRESFPLVIGQASYTMGTSGNFDTTRPTKITGQYISDTNSLNYPIELVGEDFYNGIDDKTIQGIPEYLYVSYGFPLATLYFYLVPDVAYTLHLDSEKPLAELTNLTQTISLPPGYMAAIQWNLAIERMPAYQKEPTPFQYKQAERYLSAIKNINAANRVQTVTLNVPGKQRYESGLALIKSGDY